MARFFGAVGYAAPVETSPGVYEESFTERMYYGDVLEAGRRLESGDNVNGDVSLSHRISIVADAYANENISAIRYVKWAGACWIVKDVKVEPPRLILSLGGVYHGPTGWATRGAV